MQNEIWHIHPKFNHIKCNENGEIFNEKRNGKYPVEITVDHINQVRTDNNASNLRWATREMQNLNRSNTVPVEQICLTTGNVIGTFSSTASARKAIGAINIADVISGKRSQCGGFFWKRIEEK